jgi:integrase
VLTDTQCRKAKPEAKAYKLSDSKGLFLYVAPSGLKSWRWKFRMGQAEKLLVLGSYPDLSLVEARELRDEAAKQRRQGVDPTIERKQRRAREALDAANTFEAVATAWHTRQSPKWAKHHAANVLSSLKKEVFPRLGKVSLQAIDSPMVLELLRKIEHRGAVDLAHRTQQRISDVFIYAIASGLTSNNPAAMLQKALRPNRNGHYPALRSIDHPMSENAISVMYRRLPAFRGRHVPHGWRTTFSTIMNERALVLDRGGDRAVIDLMLAHKPEGVEAIYNRAAYMPRRRQLAQEWADLLLEGLPPAFSLLEGKRA